MGDIGPKKLVQKYRGLKCIVYIAGAIAGFFHFKSIPPFVSMILGVLFAGLIFQMLEFFFEQLMLLLKDSKPPS